MIRFIDRNNGHVFNGEDPYVFWFDGGQSTNIIYTQTIYLLSDSEELSFTLPTTQTVFNIIDIESVKSNPMNFQEALRYSITLQGLSYEDQYIYTLYLCARSESVGEMTEKITIGSGMTINIGADFYDENESLYINLSNMGVEIPDSIQKALYESHLREDSKNNILLNRKFKELISNYWDIIGGRGSYKSLINSLKWFEYGGLARLDEIWKQKTAGVIRYSQERVKMIINDIYKDRLRNFAKTTYVSIYLPLTSYIRNENGELRRDDEEKNPLLIDAIMKWSREEMSLKMSLLGNFYQTFFMPIHLDLLHCTVEDIVFTNNLKICEGEVNDRIDEVLNFESIMSNIEDGALFYLTDITAQCGPETILGVQWREGMKYEDVVSIGVEDMIGGVKNDDDIKTFGMQLYGGIGVKIPVSLKMRMSEKDAIKSTIILYNNKPEIFHTTVGVNEMIEEKNYKVVNFNLLCKKAGDYDIKIQFNTINSKTYTTRLVFSVIDPFLKSLKVYKVIKKPYPLASDLIENKNEINNYFLTRQIDNILFPNKYHPGDYKIYLPVGSNKNIGFNHLFILKGDYMNDSYLKKHYFLFRKEATLSTKTDSEINIIYTICISKKFDFKFKGNKNLYNIQKETYTYIPQFHTSIALGGDELKDYIINQDTLLYVVPEIRFGKYINSYEWTFHNASLLKDINLPSVKEPFITPTKESGTKTLEKGYYDIIFRYGLVDGEVSEIHLNSAFIVK